MLQEFLPKDDNDYLPGLLAEYYEDRDMTKVIKRQFDPLINRPKAQDQIAMAIRWTGYINIPKTYDYEFTSMANDGCRLWINDILVIDNWLVHDESNSNSAKINLEGGMYHKIKLEYFTTGGESEMKLMWTTWNNKSNPVNITAENLFHAK